MDAHCDWTFPFSLDLVSLSLSRKSRKKYSFKINIFSLSKTRDWRKIYDSTQCLDISWEKRLNSDHVGERDGHLSFCKNQEFFFNKFQYIFCYLFDAIFLLNLQFWKITKYVHPFLDRHEKNRITSTWNFFYVFRFLFSFFQLMDHISFCPLIQQRMDEKRWRLLSAFLSAAFN